MVKILIVLLFSLQLNAEEISVAADEWCPHNCKPGDKMPGYGIEILQMVAQKMNLNLRYEVMPWTRAIADARAGKYTMIIGASKEEGKGFIFPDEPMNRVQDGFWILRTDPWRYTGKNSVKGRRIGIIQDYNYGEITPILNQEDVTVAVAEDGLIQNIERLEKGRINVLIEEEKSFLYTITKLGKKDKFINASKVNVSGGIPVYIAISPQYADAKKLSAIISETIKELRSNGRLKEILKKYGVVE